MYFSNCMYRVNIRKQDMIQYSSWAKRSNAHNNTGINISYKASLSTLLQRGKEICEAMETSKTGLITIFEPFLFFEDDYMTFWINTNHSAIVILWD
jgi:hypothetical protein